jgi:starch synthase
MLDSYNEGLKKTLNVNKHKIFGILNGIDENIWDPEKDNLIFKRYSRQSSTANIKKHKEQNEKALFKMFHLKYSNKPLFISVTRLVPQKGPQLIKDAAKHIIKKDAQFFLLGTTSIKKLHKEFSDLQKKLQNTKEITIHLTYNEKLAHLLYAAADFIIIPSFFEPCGLTQLISFRYFTIPIVREIGGLKDTVFDIKKYPQKGNGYTFKKFSSAEFLNKIDIAYNDFINNPNTIKKLYENIKKINHNWQEPAKKYLKLYNKAFTG